MAYDKKTPGEELREMMGVESEFTEE